MNEKESLINLPLDEARKIKWQWGRAKYGAEFVGHPLEQLDSELLDALNYVEEAERQGYSLHNVDSYLRILSKRVQDAYKRGPTTRAE